MILVVKLGTSTLTAGTDRLSRRRILDLVRQAAALRDAGHRVVFVSSGAVAAGREALGFADVGRGMPVKQMLAAVGQARLMQVWSDLFALYEIVAGQVLLTRAELATRLGYLNARDALLALLEFGIVPVVNENDTVATEEIRLGDNDSLSALVANLIDADLLILLTDLPGLYTADPRTDPAAILIDEVAMVDDTLIARAGGSGTAQGTGGMRTKLTAARLAGQAGTASVIASGAEADVLLRLAAGERVGTRFPATVSHRESRKRWLLSEPPQGAVHVDAGAAERLRRGGASLLPVGVTGADGAFERGAIVRVTCAGDVVAVGMVAYAAAEVRAIAGARSAEIGVRLGYVAGDEVIHRDDLVLL